MKYVALILFVILPISLAAQEAVPERMDYNKGYAQGQEEGSRVGQANWMGCGLVGGLVGGCIGGGVVWLVASGDTPTYIPDGPSEFRIGYVEGYKDATKLRKKQKALIGGIAGTVIGSVVVLVFLSQLEWELEL